MYCVYACVCIQSSVPTLMDLCIDFIVSQFDENGSNGTESSVQFLSGDVREKLMLQLLRRRKLTATNSLVWNDNSVIYLYFIEDF